MERMFSYLIVMLVYFFSPRHNAEIRFLKAQIRIMKNRVSSKRIIPTAEEKSELIRLGAIINHDVNDLMEIVKPDTYRRWLDRSQKGKIFKNVGRPRLTKEIRELVMRLAKENILWGYRRIVGEMKKLGFHLGVTTAKRILTEAGIHPTPEKEKKKPPLDWMTFIHAHMESIIACDFFVKDVYTLTGKMTAYVLVFIHLKSRRVFYSPPTYSPDSAWVTQQARNAIIWCHEEKISPRFLIRDGDKKFSRPFNTVWKTEGARIIQIPHGVPQANSFCESHVASTKREVLDFFICFSLSQLAYITQIWHAHYNKQRPHQGRGIGNNVLHPNFKPIRDGPIKCQKALGGIIKSYYREAA